ncbi:hypothetical protein SAMN05444166_5221 [Singulisphaera sp. GP187]|uniref:prenyltransferase/squalene oxidase repeat-containing protein n=1 Tax=Singulisphaera sp. GP187 TaxID=1882752 RepID=UPI0009289E72|nr:prenyltransferase/squalene oxidase repeat-containing protein [Singulisphaera sp. GP187]SIO56340.1 hypothetical protein SAMN05444166_5221 [Singulisphaera sp. GP187]
MRSNVSWITAASELLLRLRSGADGWGYRPGDPPAVEPTVLAGLGLRCTGASTNHAAHGEAPARAARWVARMQRPDGSVRLSAELVVPQWATSYALLLWANVDGFASQGTLAAQWLEQSRGKSFPKIPGPVGHDTSLVGWPWVEGTHSWVEPTAMALVALARIGPSRSSRVTEGARLLSDRALPTGGWNYGNSVVFQAVLRPQPGPTGLVLLALASLGVQDRSVGPALEYLESALPGVRSAQSLCWGILGLSAWNRRPAQAAEWLRDAYDELKADATDDPFGLAHIVLAASEQALDVLGLTVRKEARTS